MTTSDLEQCFDFNITGKYSRLHKISDRYDIEYIVAYIIMYIIGKHYCRSMLLIKQKTGMSVYINLFSFRGISRDGTIQSRDFRD